jgi:chromosome segregation ATPase
MSTTRISHADHLAMIKKHDVAVSDLLAAEYRYGQIANEHNTLTQAVQAKIREHHYYHLSWHILTLHADNIDVAGHIPQARADLSLAQKNLADFKTQHAHILGENKQPLEPFQSVINKTASVLSKLESLEWKAQYYLRQKQRCYAVNFADIELPITREECTNKLGVIEGELNAIRSSYQQLTRELESAARTVNVYKKEIATLNKVLAVHGHHINLNRYEDQKNHKKFGFFAAQPAQLEVEQTWKFEFNTGF